MATALITTEPLLPATAAPRLLRLEDLFGALEADAAARYTARAEGTPLGPITGLPRLDDRLGAALPPGLHSLHGQPGAGKTAFLLQVAAMCGCPALFVTTELDPVALLRRLIARVTRTALDQLTRGEFAPSIVRALAVRASAAAPDLLLLDATTAPAPPALLQEAAAVARRGAPHLLLAIDSVHPWAQMQYPGVKEYEALNQAVLDLQCLARTLGCPILASWERNRASMESGGMSAAAGTRKIEYTSETVMDMTRSSDTRLDTRDEVAVTLTMAKNRNGVGGATIPLRYHGAFQQFREA